MSDLSLSQGIFLDNLKAGKVTPIYNIDEKTDLENCTPISVLPGFSKVLERLMYNRFFKYLTYLTENDKQAFWILQFLFYKTCNH